MAKDNCIHKCTPIAGQPPIYVGLYVDDLVYYSKSDKVEQWLLSMDILKSNGQTIDSNPDILWGMLERGLEDKDSEELTPLIKSKSMTRHKKSNKSSKYKDPNLSRSDGHESRHLEIACE